MSNESQAAGTAAPSAASATPRARARNSRPLLALTFRGFSPEWGRYLRCFLAAILGTAALVGALTGAMLAPITAICLFAAVAIVTTEFQQLGLSDLRRVGIPRGALIGIACAQAVLVGAAAAALGVVVGLWAASLNLPADSSPPPALALVAFGCGLGLTVLAALLGSLLSSLPISESRDPARLAVIPAIVGISLAIVGGGLVYIGAAHTIESAGITTGLGVAVFLVGILVAMPMLCRPLDALLAWPARLMGSNAAYLASRRLTRDPLRWAAYRALVFLSVVALVILWPWRGGIQGLRGLAVAFLVVWLAAIAALLVMALGALANRAAASDARESDLLEALGLPSRGPGTVVVFEAVFAAASTAILGVAAGFAVEFAVAAVL